MLYCTPKDDIPTVLALDVGLEAIQGLLDQADAVIVQPSGNPAYPLEVRPASKVEDIEVMITESNSGEVLYDSDES